MLWKFSGTIHPPPSLFVASCFLFTFFFLFFWSDQPSRVNQPSVSFCLWSWNDTNFLLLLLLVLVSCSCCCCCRCCSCCPSVVAGRDVKVREHVHASTWRSIDWLCSRAKMMILHRFARTTTDSVTVLLSWCSIGPVNSGSFPAEVCSSTASPIFSIFQLLKKKQNWKHSRIIFVFDTKKKRESKSLEREIRSLERGTEFLFGQERDCSGLFYFFFFSSPLCGQRADRDQLLPLDWH